jgi:aldose 1-epimerase
MELSISTGSSTVLVNTLGAHAASVTLKGEDVIKPSADGNQTHGGIAVLIPYAGRVKRGRYTFEGRRYALPTAAEGHAIHGFAKDVDWRVVEEGRGSVKLRCLAHGQGYPGRLEVTIAYMVGQRDLSTDCAVKNTGENDCPLVVGFHPFVLARDWHLSTGGRAFRYELKDRYFPTGRRAPFSFADADPRQSYDDCFRVAGELRIESEGRSFVIARRGMPYIVMYNGKYAEGRSVAIEPYTGLPDAFNNGIGLKTLAPGETFTCGYTIALSK